MSSSRLLATTLLLVGAALAQQPAQPHPHRHAPGEPCGFVPYRQHLIDSLPGQAQAFQQVEQHTQQAIAQQAIALAPGTLIRIPVVVHLLWNTPNQNLTDMQIQSQIQVLNEDFRRTNADAGQTLGIYQGVAADTEIEFCLATVNPNGQPTTGINRRQVTLPFFTSTLDNMKSTAAGGQDPWPTSDYMNIWVCELEPGLYGYATPPGTVAANLDGIVVSWTVFGRPSPAMNPLNAYGRTAVHEVGHYLNLRHIWGNIGGCADDDLVADTPACIGPTNGCPTSIMECGSQKMFQNYMDYTDGNCMNLFTLGQKARMRAVFCPGGARVSLLTSPAACPPPGPTVLYQTNTNAAYAAVSGIPGTATSVATLTVPSGTPLNLGLVSTSAGALWELAYGIAPAVPNGGGAIVASDGQMVNVDVTDPFFGLLFNFFQSPPFVTAVLNFTPTSPGAITFQMLVLDPSMGSGLAISQPNRLIVQ